MAVPQSIRLPDDLADELEEDREANGSPNASDHLRSVIRDGLKYRAALKVEDREELERLTASFEDLLVRLRRLERMQETRAEQDTFEPATPPEQRFRGLG